jgi:putative FmdB family regulatory protein
MPLYEYRCSKCEKKIEVIRKFSDPPLTEHEGCGGTLEQLLSAPAFQLKGTGWYVTDYAKAGAKPSSDSGGKPGGDSKDSEAKASTSKDGEGNAGEKKASESKSSESKGDTKTESKPAATTTKAD